MALQEDIQRAYSPWKRPTSAGSRWTFIAEGEVDLGKQKIDVVVLVAPFSTMNWLIRNTPIPGTIMGGTLISIRPACPGILPNPDVAFSPPRPWVREY